MPVKELTLEIEIEVRNPINRRTGGRRASVGPALPDAPHIPRLARLMALAIKFEEMIARGEIRDYADLARLGYVTRARVTQIMNLLNLAPDVQELLLEADGDLKLKERYVRHMTTHVSWDEQRRLFGVPPGSGT